MADLTEVTDHQLETAIGNTSADLVLAERYEHNAHLIPAIRAHMDALLAERDRRRGEARSLAIGDRVRIVAGPYAGVVGRLTGVLPSAADGLTHGVVASHRLGSPTDPDVFEEHGYACRPEDLEPVATFSVRHNALKASEK